MTRRELSLCHSYVQLFSVILCLCLPNATRAAQAQTPAPSLAGIAHVAFRVSDLEKSREFYKRLGYEEAFAMSKEGAPTEAFIKINDRQFIELYPRRDSSQKIGFLHVCFEAADISALHQEYLGRGLAPGEVKRAGAGNLLFTMEGPEQQNIEYTQYMPGSRHTNDKGLHLGPARISSQIVGIGIEMKDPAAAASFYEQKLGFGPGRQAFDPGHAALELPGRSDEQVEFVPQGANSTFRLLLGAPELRRAAAQLGRASMPFEKRKSVLMIRDPDGNTLVLTNGMSSATSASRTFVANDYGAVGDGKSLSTVAIQKAIDAAAKSGGTVVLRPGTYLTGSLFLKSGVTLDLGEGVILLGSEKLADYPMMPTRIAGIEMTWPSALINVRDQHDVTITGTGTIDGDGAVWWKSYWDLRANYEPKGLRGRQIMTRAGPASCCCRTPPACTWAADFC